MPTLFALIPNQISERLAFRTDVRSAPAGEIRDSLRDPTQNLTFRFVADETVATQIRTRYRANFLGEWYVPIYQDMSRLAAPVIAGATSIDVLPGDYAAGSKAVIMTAASSEVLDVVAYDGSTLTVSATTAEHQANAIIAPLATCITPEGLASSLTYARDTIDIRFLRTDNRSLAANAYPELEGLPVLDDASIVATPLSGATRRALDLIDSGFGAYSVEIESDYTRERQSLRFIDGDRATRWSRRQFIHYLRGRDGAFWLPSWRQDLTLDGPITSGFRNIQFIGFGSEADHLTLVGQYLEFAEGNTVRRRKIESTSEFVGVVQFTLTAPVGAAFTAAARVSLLRKMRLDTDEIDLTHEYVGGTDFMTEIATSAVEVLA